MGQIIFDTATTINGWIADEQNSLAWLFAVENGDTPDAGLFPADAAVLVEGSTTYEWILAEQDILAHPEKWQDFHGEKTTFVQPVRGGETVNLGTSPEDAAITVTDSGVEAGGLLEVYVQHGDTEGKVLMVPVLDAVGDYADLAPGATPDQ